MSLESGHVRTRYCRDFTMGKEGVKERRRVVEVKVF